MFARYAYAPNALGYCGPADATALRNGSARQIRAAAQHFTGAWPYLRVMSAMTGIADPLDERLVESYWHGGGIGAEIEPSAFLDRLLTILGPAAGHYWTHLTPQLADEAAPNHAFHVFGVYPWSRLLDSPAASTASSILDNCRITPARVMSRDGARVRLRSRRLVWNGRYLSLGPPSIRTVTIALDGRSPIDPRCGDQVALHWGQPAGPLTPAQVAEITISTLRQLAVTNHRLHPDP
ncbi:hypothetical protein GLP40_28515 [Nocardia sp. CT2-14]|uniref:Uncharacterized protein n=2 Tax=Nocardia aurantiaca TaxID=2675850 RepID=A0A6I3L590_9NOCA|nr:hypothetical protein [Nocardia aurantiaca]